MPAHSPNAQPPADTGAIAAHFAAGGDIASLHGLSDDSFHLAYAAAVFHYSSGNPVNACRILQFLCKHKHKDADLWLALSRAARAAGEDQLARRAGLASFMLRPDASEALELARAYLAAEAREEAQKLIAAARFLDEHKNPPSLADQITALESFLAAGS